MYMEIKELGHVVLYVHELERSRRFYENILGWRSIPVSFGGRAAMFSSGRTHHELLLLEVGPDAAPVPAGSRLGMYHFGLKVGESDDELRDALVILKEHDVKVVGTSDHGVTHSLYIEDPDGNEIELYIDVQPAVWKEHPEAVGAMPRPLSL